MHVYHALRLGRAAQLAMRGELTRRSSLKGAIGNDKPF
jgi:hypothetical protein